MSILFAAIKAFAGLAAATDVSLTVANLASEGAAFFPEINDAKAYIEYAREEIPKRIDVLNAKRMILNTEVDLISQIQILEKETYENSAQILKEVTEDLEKILKDKGLSKESIAHNPVDFSSFVEAVQANEALHKVVFGTHVGALLIDSPLLVWNLYSDYKFFSAHNLALSKMPPKAKQIFFGTKNPKYFQTLPKASRSTLLLNGAHTMLSLVGIGMNIYTADLVRDEYIALATVERKNLEALDQAKADQEIREQDQLEMAEGLKVYYLTIMTELLRVTKGSHFYDILLQKNQLNAENELDSRNFAQIAAVLPDIKIYLDQAIYEILKFKVRADERKSSGIARAVELMTVGIVNPALLFRRLYSKVPVEEQYLSLEDVKVIVSEYAKVIEICAAQLPVPESIPELKFLKNDNFQYIYDFAVECS